MRSVTRGRLGRTIAGIAIVFLAIPRVSVAQTVDEILAKYFQARGGDKWTAIGSLRITGTVLVNGVEAPVTVLAKRPNQVKQEIDLKGRVIVSAFDGTKAWMLDPGGAVPGPQPLEGVQADLMKRQADFDGPLSDHKTKGYTVEFVGADSVGGKPAYKLKVTRAPGDILYEYLDVDSGLELKRSADVSIEGVRETVDTELSNYQAVDGVMVPYVSRTTVKGRPPIQITVTKVEFNVPVDEKAFQLPGK